MFDKYTAPSDEGGLGLKPSAAITKIADELDVSIVNNMNDVLLEQAYNKINNDSQPG